MPLNRFLTFVKPYINLAAGALAAFLIAKANVLGIPGLGEHGDDLATAIAAALAWIVTQGATQLGDLKWLRGHQLQLVGDAQVQAAALAAPSQHMSAAVEGIDSDHDELIAAGENLPTDEEEFTAPPDPREPAAPAGLIDPAAPAGLTGRVDRPADP